MHSVAQLLERFEQLCGPMKPDQLELLLPRQCWAAVEVLAVDAVGISVLLEGQMRVPLGASSEDATVAERLQFTLGEGPCLHAFTQARPVLVGDVADPASVAWSTWPVYAQQLLAHTPFVAVFALPLTSAGMTIGTLSLYRRRVGAIDPTDLGDALAVTNAIFDNLLQTGTFGGADGSASRWLDLPLAKTRTVVWQAMGMATVELAQDPADALALLRSYAYGNNRLLDDVAADIVAGRLPLHQLHP